MNESKTIFGLVELSTNLSEIKGAGSYSITKSIKMSGDYTFPSGVTLYFNGGRIIGHGILTGNHTRVVAPLEQIFYDQVASTMESTENSKDITPKFGPSFDTTKEIVPAGTWDIEVAYPHWFGMKTASTILKENNIVMPDFNATQQDEEYISFEILDSSRAINKAIIMKHVGKVFIPKGRYVVTHTICLMWYRTMW